MTMIEERNIAADPTTSEEVLMELSRNKCRSVRWLVASNPNTPKTTLERLLAEDKEYLVIIFAWSALRKLKALESS